MTLLICRQAFECQGPAKHQCFVMQEPQLFKLVFGGTLGLLVTPVIALLALAAKGRQYSEALAAQRTQQERVAEQNRTLNTVV